MRRRINSYTNDPVELFFENKGFFRKIIPQDGSCLFRAFADYLCSSQFDHLKLRNSCLDFIHFYEPWFQQFTKENIKDHIKKMRNLNEIGGTLEIVALSLLYRVDVSIFYGIGPPPAHVTKYGFPRKILLYFSENHYDVIYKKEYPTIAGFCEALIYEALYKEVFKMPNVLNIVDGMLHDGSFAYKGDLNVSNDITDLVEEVMNSDKNNEESVNNASFEVSSSPDNVRSPPFPYRVAKAIDKTIYRNIEYDIWRAQRREEKYGPYNASGLQNGCKVKFRCGNCFSKDELLSMELSAGEFLNGYIQVMSKDQGPVEVFIEKLGRRYPIPYKALEKVSSPPAGPSGFPMLGNTPYKMSAWYSFSNDDYHNEFSFSMSRDKRRDSTNYRVRNLSTSSSNNNFNDNPDSHNSSFHSDCLSPRKTLQPPLEDEESPEDKYYITAPPPSTPIAIPGQNRIDYSSMNPQFESFYYDSLPVKAFSDLSLTDNVCPSPYPTTYPGSYYAQQTVCWLPDVSLIPGTCPYGYYGWNYYPSCITPVYNGQVPPYAPTPYLYSHSVPGTYPPQDVPSPEVLTPEGQNYE